MVEIQSRSVRQHDDDGNTAATDGNTGYNGSTYGRGCNVSWVLRPMTKQKYTGFAFRERDEFVKVRQQICRMSHVKR
jgi:hypothetical protein